MAEVYIYRGFKKLTYICWVCNKKSWQRYIYILGGYVRCVKVGIDTASVHSLGV